MFTVINSSIFMLMLYSELQFSGYIRASFMPQFVVSHVPVVYFQFCTTSHVITRSAPSLLQFRRDLKTALFQSSYSSP